MQSSAIQNPDDYVDQFRKRHKPIPASEQPSQVKDYPNPEISILQRTIKRFTSAHTECNYQVGELQIYVENLNGVLAKLIQDRQKMQQQLKGIEGPTQPKYSVNDDDELVQTLQIQNIRLREQLKIKFENAARQIQPQTVENIHETFEDLMPDRKTEEIKLLKQSLFEAEQRLSRYYMRISPFELAQLDRENGLLKQQVLRLCTQTGLDVAQFPARMYPQLKEKNRTLIDLIQRKNPYLLQLKQRSDGLDASQMVYDLQNKHLQFELARIQNNPNVQYKQYEKQRTRIRHSQLEAEYMRLQQILNAGWRIQEEAKKYNWALLRRPGPL